MGKLWIKLVTVTFLFVQTSIISAEKIEKPNSLQTQIFQIELQTLQVDGNDVYVDINGQLYSVNNLKKNGNLWFAETAVGETCAWGHPLCGYCHLCHHRICPLYQTRCSKSQ